MKKQVLPLQCVTLNTDLNWKRGWGLGQLGDTVTESYHFHLDEFPCLLPVSVPRGEGVGH